VRLLAEEQSIGNDEIIKVFVYQPARLAENFIAYPPQTSVDTASSLKYLVAVYLLTRKIGVDWYENYDNFLKREDFQKIADKVEIIKDLDLQKIFDEENIIRGKVIILTSSKKYEKELNLEDLKGNPRNNPLSYQEITNKFTALSEPVIGPKNVKEFLKIMETTDYSEKIRDVLSYLKP